MAQDKKKTTYLLISLISTLAFINSSKVRSVFLNIEKLGVFADYATYFEYFKQTWLDNRFDVSLWNSWSKTEGKVEISDIMKHSNNTIECFHSVLNYILQKNSHPTMSEFLEALKYIEARAFFGLNYYENKRLVKVIIHKNFILR